MKLKSKILRKSISILLVADLLLCFSLTNYISNAENIEDEQTIIERLTADNIADDILSNNNAEDYYGKVVSGYETNNFYTFAENYDWQIFYVGKNPNLEEDDENNQNHIYLTTTDYINIKDWAEIAQNSPKMEVQNGEISLTSTGNNNYSGTFQNLYTEYNGKLATTKNIIKSWLKCNNLIQPSNSSKKIEYLLDSDIWNAKFRGGIADYAIGAPTLDMYTTAYNITHPDKIIEYTSQENGYVINSETNVENDFNSLYILKDESKALGQVIASGEGGTDGIYKLSSNGKFELGYSNISTQGNLVEGSNKTTTSYSETTYGIRPIVCLNEAVELTSIRENEEISYKIADDMMYQNIKINIKADSVGVQGVQVKLFDANKNEILDDQGNQIILTTDENGEIDIGKLGYFEVGTYYYKAISGPEGYTLNTEKMYYFTIAEDETVIYEENNGMIVSIKKEETEDKPSDEPSSGETGDKPSDEPTEETKIEIPSTTISGKKYVTQITTENNTVESILTQNNLTTSSVKITNNKGEVLTGTAKLGTGTKVEILDKDNKVIDTYTVAIKGDNNGDGKINLYDILKLIELVFDEGKEYQWSDIEKLAGEYTGDGKVNLYDILRLIEYHFDGVKW